MCCGAGTALRIDDHIYEDIWLPKHLLNQLLPEVFAAFHRPDVFQVGLLLPLAILTCLGLGAALKSISSRRRLIIVAVAAAIAFDTWYLPFQFRLDPAQFDYIDWLARQEGQESIRLTHLPRLNLQQDKLHLLHQSLHGYPQTGGVVGRVRLLVNDYILANPLLADWYENIPSYCQRTRQSAQLAALDPLIADGVSHVALHHGLPNWKAFAAAFAIVAPAYQDDHMTLLRIRDMRDACAGRDFRDDPYSLQRDFLLDAPIQPQSESLLSLHASQAWTSMSCPCCRDWGRAGRA